MFKPYCITVFFFSISIGHCLYLDELCGIPWLQYRLVEFDSVGTFDDFTGKKTSYAFVEGHVICRLLFHTVGYS